MVVEKEVAQRAVCEAASLKTCPFWIRHVDKIETK